MLQVRNVVMHVATAAIASAAFAFSSGAFAQSVKPTVTVVNTTANPVPVAVSALPPTGFPQSVRYQRTISISNPAWVADSGQSFHTISGDILGIPANKVLVLEYVSADVVVNPGEKGRMTVVCQGGGVSPANVHLELQSAGEFDGYEHLTVSETAKCYSGSNLIVFIVRNSETTVPDLIAPTTEFSLVGYLIAAP